MIKHHINPFVRATADVLKNHAGMDLQKDNVHSGRFRQAPSEVNLIIGVTGRLNGSVSIGMSRQTANSIATAMTKSALLDKQTVGSILTALGTAITSEASLELREMGFDCSSQFPTLVMGQDVSVSTPIRLNQIVCFSSCYGEIEVKVSFLERKSFDLAAEG